MVEEVAKEVAKEAPIVKEANAPKAKASPSKIEESKKKVEDQKVEDKKRKPSHSDMMQSMRKQTAKRLNNAPPKAQTKPRSFPDPTFKPQ